MPNPRGRVEVPQFAPPAGRANFESVYAPLSCRCAGALRQFGGRPRSARLGRATMNPKPIELAKNPLLAAALPAPRRARQRAEEIAIATNTALVMVIDGKVVRVYPGAAETGKTSSATSNI